MSTQASQDRRSSLHDVLNSHISRWPGRGAAWATHAGDISAGAGAVNEIFEWASVTKLLVAVACWVAVEEGSLAFEGAAGPEGSTLGHLLAHASGLPFEGNSPVAPPAKRRIYSNIGIETAAAQLCSRTGMAFGDYLRAGVLEPLGMTATVLAGSPAHGAKGPLEDLARLAAELLSPSLISAGTWRTAVSTAWPELAGVLPGFGRQTPCEWGLGPEIRGHKYPHWTGARNSASTFGHFGQSGAFLWVDPVAGIALAGLSSEPFGEWAKKAWPALSDEVLTLLAGP